MLTKWLQDSKYKSVISFIEQADDTQIDQIINAVIRRYAIQFPDWEIMFLSMPRNDPAQRLKAAEFFFNSIKQEISQNQAP